VPYEIERILRGIYISGVVVLLDSSMNKF